MDAGTMEASTEMNKVPHIYCSFTRNLDQVDDRLGEIEDFIIFKRSDGSHWAAHWHDEGFYISCCYSAAPKLICFGCEEKAPFVVQALVKLLGIWKSEWS